MFGGAYYPIPSNLGGAAPVNALFVARLDAGAWTVSLEDTPAFAAMLQEAPTGLASDEERQIFSTRDQNLQQRLDATALAAGQDLGLSLPYARNDPSWGTWGVHGDTGSSRPYNSIDFKAGDGRVLASRGGVAYKFCTNGRWPFIKVVHDNGFTTGYYHLRNVPSIANGQRVAEGDFLGQTGVELPCGGSADGNHVHWSLWRGGSDGRAEPVNGKLIGGWTWFEGSKPYSGYAERNGKRVAAGSNGLVNHGHGGTTPAPSTTPSGSPCTGTGCKRYTGSIASAGRYATHPGDNGFQHAGGPLKGWLEGPSGANFDLILGRYNDRTGQWDRAVVSEGPGSKERVSHDAAAGKYRWRISGVAGKGSYTLWTQP